MRHVAACPYPLATGKPCGHVAKGETEDQLDAVMRGHVQLHHPGEMWPPHTEPEVCCSCGSTNVTYHNYREQPFCEPCANGTSVDSEPTDG